MNRSILQARCELLLVVVMIFLFGMPFIGTALAADGEQKVHDKNLKHVYSTTYPVQYFAWRIGGEVIESIFPLPEGEDPIFWEPSDEILEEYQKADLILVNGAECEKWVDCMTLPISKLVDTTKPLQGQLLRYEGVLTHSHGPGGAHAHEGVDGNTWVDPIYAKVQAEVILKAFERHFPESKEVFKGGFTSLSRDLDQLNATLESFHQQVADATPPLFTSHTVYNYIAKRYGWNIKNLNLDPEQIPNASALAVLKTVMKSFPAKYIIWDAQPAEQVRAIFERELGLESVYFTGCDSPKPEGDYLAVMKQNLENIRPIFTAPPK